MPPTNARVVDDHELLVMAVHRALPRIGGDVHARMASEAAQLGLDVAACRTEDRQGRPGPGEHADVDPLTELAQQLLERESRPFPFEPEVRREEPAGEQDALARLPHGSHHGRQRVGAVDEDLDLVPRLRSTPAVCPERWPDVEGALPADASQPPAVVRHHRVLEALADDAVQAIRKIAEVREGFHHASFPARGTFTRIGQPASVEP